MSTSSGPIGRSTDLDLTHNRKDGNCLIKCEALDLIVRQPCRGGDLQDTDVVEGALLGIEVRIPPPRCEQCPADIVGVARAVPYCRWDGAFRPSTFFEASRRHRVVQIKGIEGLILSPIEPPHYRSSPAFVSAEKRNHYSSMAATDVCNEI